MTAPQQQPREAPTLHLRSVAALVGNIAAAAGETVIALGAAPEIAAAAVVGGAAMAVTAVVKRRQNTIRNARAGRRPGIRGLADRVRQSTRRAGGGTGRSGGGRLSRLLGGRAKGGSPTGATGRRPGTPGSATGRRGIFGGRPTGRGTTGGGRRGNPTGRGATGRNPFGNKPGSPSKRPGSKPKSTSQPNPAAKKPAPPKISDKVRGATKPGDKPKTTAPAPKPAATRRDPITTTTSTTKQRTTDREPAGVSAGTGGAMGGKSPMDQLLAIIETDMNKVAKGFRPEGMEEVISEYEKWPKVQDALTKLWKSMRDKGEQEFPLKPAASNLISTVENQQKKVSQAAEIIPGVIRRMHRDKIDALGDRKNRMWDHRANPNTAGK